VGFFGYAENFVYAPSVQKEREIVEKTGAQILRQTGEESHNGSASPVYGIWRFAGGGSLIGKGCHPLGGMLYLKRAEGIARHGAPIRPASVSARTHQLTRLAGYRDAGLIRTDYHDVEDYGFMHVVFEDGTVGDVTASEVALGGIYDYIEVFANNHRTRCRISPTGLMDTYNPRAEQYKDNLSDRKGEHPGRLVAGRSRRKHDHGLSGRNPGLRRERRIRPQPAIRPRPRPRHDRRGLCGVSLRRAAWRGGRRASFVNCNLLMGAVFSGPA